MLGWLFGKRHRQLEEKTEKSFSAVKNDIERVSKWIKHLHGRDKQLFDVVDVLKSDLSTIKEDLALLRESGVLGVGAGKGKQAGRKKAVYDEQTAVYAVQNAVQTAVQTGNFYEILKGFTSNERLVIMTLANNDMKLSYEDLALLLGKERATIRGQINSIKQKSEGILNEVIERNGKKRVFVSDFVKEKLAKYAKVRVGGSKKVKKDEKIEQKESEINAEIGEKGEN